LRSGSPADSTADEDEDKDEDEDEEDAAAAAEIVKAAGLPASGLAAGEADAEEPCVGATEVVEDAAGAVAR
jgi:hypothetical protein